MMRPDSVMSLSLSTNTATTTTLTPTTFKKITQLFESEECLQSLQNFEVPSSESAAGFVPPSVAPATIIGEEAAAPTKAKRTYANLDSKLTWQGGVTQVVTPCKTSNVSVVQPFIVLAEEENQENFAPAAAVSEEAAMIPTHVEAMKAEAAEELPTPTRRSHRLARSNTAEIVKNLLEDREDEDPDYNPMEDGEETASKAKKRSAKRPAASASSSSAAPSKKRNNGGRKPKKHSGEEESMEPEEFERLTVRRQRNKEAAARCRKRRVDLTNKLQAEVDSFESKRRLLEDEIKTLKAQKEDLEFLLQAHAHTCKISGAVATVTPTFHIPAAPAVAAVQPQPQHVVVAVKSEPVLVEPVNAPYVIPEQVMLGGQEANNKPKRPMSLSLTVKAEEAAPNSKEGGANISPSGVAIETPSTVCHGFGFDSVTTGLTPMAPSLPNLVSSIATPTLNTPTCSAQQRQTSAGAVVDSDVSTPDYVAL